MITGWCWRVRSITIKEIELKLRGVWDALAYCILVTLLCCSALFRSNFSLISTSEHCLLLCLCAHKWIAVFRISGPWNAFYYFSTSTFFFLFIEYLEKYMCGTQAMPWIKLKLPRDKKQLLSLASNIVSLHFCPLILWEMLFKKQSVGNIPTLQEVCSVVLGHICTHKSSQAFFLGGVGVSFLK